MNETSTFIDSMLTGATEVGSMYLSFFGGIILSVTIIVVLATLHTFNSKNKE